MVETLPSQTRFLVIGAGLAGLSAAHALGSECLVLERDNRVGGLAATDSEDGFHFDCTGHWFHSRVPEVRKLVRRLLGDNLLDVARRAEIVMRDVRSAYPFQANTRDLPPDIGRDCLLGFIEAEFERRQWTEEPDFRSFADFVLAWFGEGIARHFMFPYNSKIWTIPPEEMNVAWCERFVPRPSLEDVVEGALKRSTSDLGYNVNFMYPRHGGIQPLAEALAAEVRADIRLGCEVEEIDPKGRRVTLADGRQVGYERLIVTAPLNRVADMLVGAPRWFSEAAGQLRHTTITYFNVGIDRPHEHNTHWLYFPEEKYGFYRVGFPSNVNPLVAPEGCGSMAVEFSHQGRVDSEELRSAAVCGLVEAGLLDSEEEIIHCRARTIPVAYVLYDHAYPSARSTAMKYLDEQGVLPAGRYARWVYSSMEGAMTDGFDAARVARGEAEFNILL